MILKTFKNINSKIRNQMMIMVREKHGVSDLGVNGVLSAIGDFRDHVIVLFENSEIMGAISYYLSKKNYIEIDHIGVIKQNCGYGTILMKSIFKIAKEKNRYPVTLMSNGFANEFYEKIGMERLGDKTPIHYIMTKKKLDCY
jgi:hypothetical protein